MNKIGVFYGSTTGTTEDVAHRIAEKLNVPKGDIHDASKLNDELVKEYDVLVLGTSTWGAGELQDDWATGIAMLDGIDLTGRKVAVFGLGDQSGFGDTFVDAMGILADKAKERGAVLVGETSAEGYAHTASSAEKDGKFCGLALDDNNEPDKTADRISQWVDLLKQVSA